MSAPVTDGTRGEGEDKEKEEGKEEKRGKGLGVAEGQLNKLEINRKRSGEWVDVEEQLMEEERLNSNEKRSK